MGANEEQSVPEYLLGIYPDRGIAERVVDALEDAGVPAADVSLAVRDAGEEELSRRAEPIEEGLPFPELATHSAWERLGWQGGARPPYRDHVAPQIDYALLVAGPLAISIGGAQLGASAGGLVGALTDYGFELDTARAYYQRVVDGEALIMVRCEPQGAPTVSRVLAEFDPAEFGQRFRPY